VPIKTHNFFGVTDQFCIRVYEMLSQAFLGNNPKLCGPILGSGGKEGVVEGGELAVRDVALVTLYQ
jgi:hypothetical protein